MSQRYVHFNVNELARIAAEAVGAKSCVIVENYPDGMYNKAMLLTIEIELKLWRKFQIQMLVSLM